MDDGTFELRGVTLGEPPYVLTRPPEGVLSTGDVRVEDRPRPRRHGVISGDDLLAGKTLSFEVAILGDSPADTEQAAAALTAAFAPSAQNLWLSARVSGTPSEYSFLGRPRGATVLLDYALRDGEASTAFARCVFQATDPLRYGSAIVNGDLALTSPGAGLVYPVTYPIVYSDAGGTGSVTVINSGTAVVEWTAELVGPLTNPRLEHADSGKDIEIAATLSAGETVLLDSMSGSILLGGTAPRPSWFGAGSQWFAIEPGSNLIRLTADAGTGTAQISFRPGWV